MRLKLGRCWVAGLGFACGQLKWMGLTLLHLHKAPPHVHPRWVPAVAARLGAEGSAFSDRLQGGCLQ